MYYWRKTFMFTGVENGSKKYIIVWIGMSIVVYLEVPGLIFILFIAHEIPVLVASIPGSGAGAVASVLPGVTSVFPIRFSAGSIIYVYKLLIIKL